MSYTRSYSSSITVEGSKNVHYPASEHGGYETVHFSETVPINIDITVETTPFDNSIDNASMNVDGLTASVVAMNAANCAAIAQNAKKISDSLINGFYSLINSDITVKKSENNSQLQSKTALLLALSQDVKDKHLRMSEDVERLRAHYGSIFRDLDSELAKRIMEFDKPAFNLNSGVREDIILKPLRTIGAVTASGVGGDSYSTSSISIARIRSKVSQVLNNMSESINKNLMYRRMMKDTLWKENADDEEQISIPVAYLVSDGLNSPQKDDKYYVSKNNSTEQIISTVSSFVRSELSSSGKSIPEEEMKLIDQSFSSMVEEEFMKHDNGNSYQERVYTEILRLWHNDRLDLKQI